jgi:2-iminobutanoate/2-iminopropanoate deaminase
MKQLIKSTEAPAALGPYNHGIIYGNLIFVSGQIPLTKDGMLISDDIKDQTRQCLMNIESILTQAGSGKENILKTTIFLKNMNDFAIVNEIYSSFFENTIFPARSTVEVSRLPKDVKIEIEAISAI